MNELDTKVDEQAIEAIVESHRDDPKYDEVYLADLDWMGVNGESKHVTLLEEVGCEYVVGISYLFDADTPTS